MSCRIRYKIGVGFAFKEWLQVGENKNMKDKLVAFLKQQKSYKGAVPKKERVWLARCHALAETSANPEMIHHSGGRKPIMCKARTPDRFLLRSRLRQGPPHKCGIIRELLWDWFVDIRRSLATTISPKFMLSKAKGFAECALEHMRKTGEHHPLPILDKCWLSRWKRDFGVVFRKPNRRYKCSKKTLLGRLRAMWLNNIRVRRLSLLALGHDMAKSIFGIDEKPIHFNESGSKGARTLEIAGAPAVRLKENHAATRERASVMTTVTSRRECAEGGLRPAVEILFKGATKKRYNTSKSLRALIFHCSTVKKVHTGNTTFFVFWRLRSRSGRPAVKRTRITGCCT